MIQRALDEIEEDIWFLSLAVIHNDVTPSHKQYLEYFYAEEFADPADVIGSHTSRGMVRREKIRAYVYQRSDGAEKQRGITVGKIIAKTYSGFIHAASPHIMSMCYGHPSRFEVSGDFSKPRAPAQERDALNVYYRALTAMAVAAKAFGDDNLFNKMREAAEELEAAMG
jgi:hypothetical protein